MKIKLSIILLVLSTSISMAQNSAKAKNLLDEVYNKVKSYDNIFVDFKYSLNNEEANINTETRGDVTMQGDKYLFNYLGSKQIYDGKKVYTVVPENEEVTIEEKLDDENTITPSKMLTFYKQGHNYDWDILQNIQGRKIQFVKLTPIDTNSEIKSILLGIDVETKHIYKLIETGKNGTKTTITVNSFKIDQPLSKTLFTFDENKYKNDGYYIIRNQKLRILDRYILSRFLFNFFSSFVILMFIFIFQTIWLFIDDFAGKGLDIFIIGKFLFYLMPNLMERVIPLTVLLSSILTFGSFAENYEFAAMKASGISLQRAMLPLIVFVTFLGGVTFYFANNIIPISEQKIYNLRRNIAKVKPAAIITEGVFSDLEGTEMNMKVDRKYGENDRILENVIIHEKSKTKVNTTVIKAKSGELISSEDSDILQLVLKDGHYYLDVSTKNNKEKKKNPFTKANFRTYTINKDLSDLNDVDLDEERDVSTDKMKNISRLTKDIDSLKEDNVRLVTAFSKNIVGRMGAFVPMKKPDSVAQIAIDKKKKEMDSLGTKMDTDSILALYPSWHQSQILSSAKSATSNIITSIQGKKNELQIKYKIYRLHILSLHKKYALALSCIILFFVGAPLGAIIRKGGLGLPMVIAIILFLTYYFIGVFAGNYAKEGNINPIIGAWLSTCIMLPLGVFLTRRATADKGLMSFGSILDYFKGIFKKKDKIAVT